MYSIHNVELAISYLKSKGYKVEKYNYNHYRISLNGNVHIYRRQELIKFVNYVISY